MRARAIEANVIGFIKSVSESMPNALPITALILAGGQGRRMGGRDKGLVDYRGKPLIDWVIERIQPQVDELIISANRSLDEYAKREFRVVSDTLADFQGPLAGVLAGLLAARHEWLLVVPCDMPNLPKDLASQLYAHAIDRDAAFAQDKELFHPAVLVLNKACLGKLQDYLKDGGRSVKGLLARINSTPVEFADAAAFKNINETDQLEQ